MSVIVEKSGMIKPFKASGDVVVGNVIKLASADNYIQVAEDGYVGLKGVCVGGYQYKISTGADNTANTIADGFICDIALGGSHILKLEATGAIAKGQPIASSGLSGGKIKEHTEASGAYTQMIGYSMETASASGDIIKCLLI